MEGFEGHFWYIEIAGEKGLEAKSEGSLELQIVAGRSQLTKELCTL